MGRKRQKLHKILIRSQYLPAYIQWSWTATYRYRVSTDHLNQEQVRELIRQVNSVSERYLERSNSGAYNSNNTDRPKVAGNF
jgi:hypothetical protein